MSKSKSFKRLFICIFLFSFSFSANALDGIPLSIKVAGKNLVLNGAGIRTKFFQSAYFAGLYLDKKSNNAASIINANTPMAIRMKIASRHATLDKVRKGFLDGFKKATNRNTTPVQRQINQFMQIGFSSKIKKGDTFDFIYNPAQGVRLLKNNKQQGLIKGLPFKQALFGIWLSNKPTQASLKKSLLGQ